MRVCKPLIISTLGVVFFGVAYDVAATAGWITGDGHDHTVARVPTATTTGASLSSITFVNYNTGEEYRVLQSYKPRAEQG